MSKLIAVVSAPATTLRLATITATDGVSTITTVVLGGDEGVQPVMASGALNESVLDGLRQELSSHPLMATAFAQIILRDKGVGVPQDGVSIEYISDEYPILELQVDGYELHTLETGEVEVVAPTIH